MQTKNNKIHVVYIAHRMNDLRQKQFALHFCALARIFYIFYILYIWKWLLRLYEYVMCACGCVSISVYTYAIVYGRRRRLCYSLFPLAYGEYFMHQIFCFFPFKKIVYRCAQCTHSICSGIALSNTHTVWKCCICGFEWVGIVREEWTDGAGKGKNILISAKLV